MSSFLAPRAGRAAPPIGLRVVTGALGLVFATPFLYLGTKAIGNGWFSTLRAEHAIDPLRRTLVLAVAVSLTSGVIGTGLAWLTTRTDVPGRRVLRIVLALPLVIPSFVGAFCFIAAFAGGGLVQQWVLEPIGVTSRWRIEGLGWSVVVMTLFTYPYVYLPVVARLASLPPSIEESARALGDRPPRVFRTMVLPQVSGATAAGALIVFLYSLSEFGAVSLLRYDTLTRSIFTAADSLQSDVAFALSLLLALIALVVVSLERLVARRRVRTEAVAAGRAVVQYPLGRMRPVAAAGAWGMVLLALGAPIAVLVQSTVRGVANGRGLHTAQVWPAVRGTASFGVAAAVVTMIVVLPIAYLGARYPRDLTGRGTSAFVATGFAMPGLVLGLALAKVVLDVDLLDRWYQTAPLLVMAYVVHFGVQGLGAAQVAVGGVPARLVDAARGLGSSRLTALWRVELPLMRGGLAAGAGLVLLSTMKELPATLLLLPTGSDTLAVRIWQSTDGAFFAQAGLVSLVLIALSAVLTWLLTLRPLARRAT